MVMKMNKNEFIEAMSKELGYSIDKCTIINDILENNFFISKKSKDPIISELIARLDITDDEANHIYEAAVKLIKDEVRDKIKHPFKNRD